MKTKTLKKVLVLAVIAVMVVSLFAGCSAPQGSALERIKQSGKLIMQTHTGFPPYEYLGSDNKPAGVDIDICQAIADEIGVELEVVDTDFDGLIPSLVSGKCDLAAAGMSVTDERKKSVDFSVTYASATQYIIVPEGNNEITCVDDLSDKVVGVQLGTTGDIYMSDDGMAKEIKEYKNALEAGMDLMNGKLDAVVIDKMPAENIVAVNSGLKLIGNAFGTEEYAIAVAKGNEDLLEVINSVVSELYGDGTVDEWIAGHAEAFQAVGQ